MKSEDVKLCIMCSVYSIVGIPGGIFMIKESLNVFNTPNIGRIGYIFLPTSIVLLLIGLISSIGLIAIVVEDNDRGAYFNF